jgi:hypothetical protein
MSPGLAIVVIIAGALVVSGAITLGINRLMPRRSALLSDHGGSPALRAITTTYALVLAFVLASSLQAFQSAREQTVAEANAVVSMGNLATRLAPRKRAPVLRELACYADRVANREFAALRAGSAVPDDNTPLDRLYRALPNLDRAGQTTISATEAMLAELSTLTSARDTRIRAARESLPTLLWIVVIGGGGLLLLSVAAITIVDRPWSQYGVLAALAALLLGVVLLIAVLDRPFANGQVSISEGPMKSALVAVSQHVQHPFCTRFDASGRLLTRS